jgi:hypothetical protein
MQEEAIEIRVFVNQPKATARTKTIGNPAYAGAIGFMGHGGATDVDAAHCPECAVLGHTHDHAHAAQLAPNEHDHDHRHDDHDHDHDDDHDHGSGGQGPDATGERFDVELDLAGDLRAVEADEEVTIELVAVDVDGNEVPAERVLVDEIELDVD